MEEFELQVPSLLHKDRANEFKQEFFDHGEQVINGSALLDQMNYEDWLTNTLNNRDLSTVRVDWVQADTLFAVRKSDSKIIGMIDIRYNIEIPFLKQYGGHTGYSVRPSERRKGYATKMLLSGLDILKQHEIYKVMLGCYADNIPSIKTIEACGGVLTETKPYMDGKKMYVYWIENK